MTPARLLQRTTCSYTAALHQVPRGSTQVLQCVVVACGFSVLKYIRVGSPFFHSTSVCPSSCSPFLLTPYLNGTHSISRPRPISHPSTSLTPSHPSPSPRTYPPAQSPPGRPDKKLERRITMKSCNLRGRENASDSMTARLYPSASGSGILRSLEADSQFYFSPSSDLHSFLDVRRGCAINGFCLTSANLHHRRESFPLPSAFHPFISPCLTSAKKQQPLPTLLTSSSEELAPKTLRSCLKLSPLTALEVRIHHDLISSYTCVDSPLEKV
jgi:hypothetical protein